jgi:hypothetical protein
MNGRPLRQCPEAKMPKPDEIYSDAETVKRREDALKRMLNTPHKPHRDRVTQRKKKRLMKKIKEAGQAKPK